MHKLPEINQSLSRRYETLDLWRGVAALGVVWYHSIIFALPGSPDDVDIHSTSLALWTLSRLSIGVTIFFVISGYCISAATDSELCCRKGITSFAARRIKRIYPPFWMSLVLTTTVSFIAYKCGVQFIYPDQAGITCPVDLRPAEWLVNITLTHTWLPNVLGTYCRPLNGVSWSLCYEEQFYLLCGLLVSLGFRCGRTILAIVTTVAGAHLVCRTSGSWQALRWLDGSCFDYKWLQFALGGVLYYTVVKASRVRGRRISLALYSLPVSIIAFMLLVPEYSSFAWANPLFQMWVATSFTALLLYIRPREAGLLRALRTVYMERPLRYLGSISYSLYLVHSIVVLPITYMLKANGYTSTFAVIGLAIPLCTASSVGLAHCFFIAIEQWCVNTPVKSNDVTAPASIVVSEEASGVVRKGRVLVANE